MRQGPIAATMVALTLGMAAPVTWAGQLVVVSDSAPLGFPRGSVLEDGAKVNIPAGQALQLIDAGGKGVTIHGAYDGAVHAAGPATPADGSVVAALTQILSSPPRAVIGGVRAGIATPQPPDPWLIDLSDDATVCVGPERKAALWRPVAAKHVTLILTRLSTGEHAEVEWPAGAATIAWPAGLSIVDGETYQAAIPGAMSRPRLHIKVVPIAATSVAAAAKLADADCRAQALAMLQVIAGAHEAP